MADAPLTLLTLKEALREALKPLETRMGNMETRMDGMEGQITGIAADVAEVKIKVAVLLNINANADVRTINSLKPLTATLNKLLFTYNGQPWPAGVAQPERMVDLAVSGAEVLPEILGGGKPQWNRMKSRAFLAHAAPPTGGESEGEDEGIVQSFTLRSRCVELMGGSFERITGAMNALH
jgi:hypothetical protein